MELIGKYLKDKREERNISISSIASNLNVGENIIDKIENDDFYENNNDVYLVGHIRSYAKLLDLDSDLLVKAFKENFSSSNEDNIAEQLPKPLIQNNIFNFSKYIAFGSIVFISFIFYFVFLSSNNFENNNLMLPDLSEELSADLEKIQLENDIEINKKNILTNKLLEDSSNKIVVENFITNDKEENIEIKKTGSLVASEPDDLEVQSILNEDKITLRFLGPTWIQLRNSNNDIIVSKLMNIKSEYTFLVSDQFSLTTGNAGNIIVLINGETKGKIGKKGEVLESFVINPEFNN